MSHNFVRVRQVGTGHELTVTRDKLARFPDAYVELKRPATDPGGNPLPIKYRRSIKEAGRVARRRPTPTPPTPGPTEPQAAAPENPHESGQQAAPEKENN